MTNASRDSNRVTTLVGVSSADGTTIVPIKVNPVTNAIKIDASGLGTVTDVSVVSANGISGSVATSTTTPAITLTLADITPTSVSTSGTVASSGFIRLSNNSATTGAINWRNAANTANLALYANGSNFLTTNAFAGIESVILQTVADGNGYLQASSYSSAQGGELRLLEGSTNGTNYVALRSPASVASTVTWTLPNTDSTGTQALVSNGSGVLLWQSVGTGDVSKVGTPVDNQIGVWTGDGTIEGTAGLTYDGSNLQITGDIGATGTRITKGWFTNFEVTNAIVGSVTGNAATATALATPRAIYGNNFDGTAALTQVIASTYGGTGNGFTKFSGPATTEKTFTLPDASATLLYSGGALGTPSGGTLTNCSGLPAATGISGIIGSSNGGTGNGFTKFTGATTTEKTYTLPDASTTILTTNAAVTEAQGGTAQTTYATGDILYASGVNTLAKLAAGTDTHVLTLSGGVPTWAAAGGGGLTWGDSITDTSGTGITITAGATSASGTLPLSIVLNNTQSNALVCATIDTGTSAVAHTGLLINGKGLSTTQRPLKIDITGGSANKVLEFVSNASTTAGTSGFINMNLQNTGAGNVYGIQITCASNTSSLFANNSGIRIDHNMATPWESQGIGAGIYITSAVAGAISQIIRTGSSTTRGLVFQSNYGNSQNDAGVIGSYTSADPGVARWSINHNGVVYLQDNTAPSTTTNKLYSVSGALTWNGSALLTSIPLTPTLKSMQGASVTTATVGVSNLTPFVNMPDAQDSSWSMAFEVPTGATGISSITVWYLDTTNNNFVAKFWTGINSIGSTQSNDISDTDTVYGTTGGGNVMREITVPAAAYNALTVAAGDIFGIQMTRTGTSGSDTWSSALQIYGAEVTWS